MKVISTTKSLIFGCGCDVVRMSRIKNTYVKFGKRFLLRAYHPTEIVEFESLAATTSTTEPTTKQIQFLASRWAVKEAVTKALVQHRISFSDMSVTKRASSQRSSSNNNNNNNNNNSNNNNNKIFESLVPFRPDAQQPVLSLSTGPAALLQQLGIVHTHITLSHDEEYAYAACVIEKVQQ